MQIVGNKAKGRISKRLFQENKARQIFRKTKNFSENLACFVFLKHPFSNSPFCLITDEILKKSLSFIFLILYPVNMQHSTLLDVYTTSRVHCIISQEMFAIEMFNIK